MEYRSLGKTDLRVPAVSFGAWAIGGWLWGGTDDDDAFGEVFELILDPDFVAASERLEQFGVDECGLEPADDAPDSDPATTDDTTTNDTTTNDTTTNDTTTSDTTTNDTTTNDTTADGTTADAGNAAGLITEAAEVPDPLFDPFGDDDVVDPSEVSINGLQYHLDVSHTDATWRTRLMSFSMGGGVTVGGTVLDDVAVEVCDAVAEYVVQFEPDWEITIESYDQDDTGQYNYVGELITGTATDGC